MRELKFRAWDKLNKRYVKPVAIYLVNDKFSWVDYVGNEQRKVLCSGEFVLEQYTGTKGKNGVEIYEGDIVRHMGGGGHMRVSQVKFDRGCYNVGTHSGSSTAGKPMLLNSCMTILGNTHENPELLEDR